MPHLRIHDMEEHICEIVKLRGNIFYFKAIQSISFKQKALSI